MAVVGAAKERDLSVEKESAAQAPAVPPPVASRPVSRGST